ncbi:MAG TPA: hypothetical protein VJN19_01240 [Propionibacteriaceae bacterium]|jgi:hypothetical protein|nr:hypothetical protein [Propionibacteriaceae bacterium]
MSQTSSRYGGKWKKWLAIYVAVGLVAYLVIYFVFFAGGGGGGGGIY